MVQSRICSPLLPSLPMVLRNSRYLLFILALLASSLGCSRMNIEDFRGQEPKLHLEEYFAGRTRGWGMVHSRFGTLLSQFSVRTEGSYENGVLRFTEYFKYRDGKEQERRWEIRKIAENSYVGSANDTEEGIEGVAMGNAFTWEYGLNLQSSGDSTHYTVRDWLYLQEDGVLLSRGVMSKWGFKVAEVVIIFEKEE